MALKRLKSKYIDNFPDVKPKIPNAFRKTSK